MFDDFASQIKATEPKMARQLKRSFRAFGMLLDLNRSTTMTNRPFSSANQAY